MAEYSKIADKLILIKILLAAFYVGLFCLETMCEARSAAVCRRPHPYRIW